MLIYGPNLTAKWVHLFILELWFYVLFTFQAYILLYVSIAVCLLGDKLLHLITSDICLKNID